VENKLLAPVFDATRPLYEVAALVRPVGDTAAVFEHLQSLRQTG
jgi:hypothetical protein